MKELYQEALAVIHPIKLKQNGEAGHVGCPLESASGNLHTGIPPAFGSPTSYTLNAGELLMPNLVGKNTTSARTTGGVTMMPPSFTSTPPASGHASHTAASYIEVTDGLYYSAGHLGTLRIPVIDLTVKVYEGTGDAALKKGAGHFKATSI